MKRLWSKTRKKTLTGKNSLAFAAALAFFVTLLLVGTEAIDAQTSRGAKKPAQSDAGDDRPDQKPLIKDPRPNFPAIHQLRIYARNAADLDEKVASMVPGDTLRLWEGQRVRLRMTASGANKGEFFRPRARFSIESGNDRIRISEINLDQGTAIVEAISNPRRSTGEVRPIRIGYEVLDRLNLRRGLERTGLIKVEILETVATAPSAPAATAGPSTSEDLVRLLYRGILLREADAEGAAGRIDAVNRGGFPALVEEAKKISESRESHLGVYNRGHSYEDRLEALYREFLEMRFNEIREPVRRQHLTLLEEGEIDRVVQELISSQVFVKRHGFDGSRLRNR